MSEKKQEIGIDGLAKAFHRTDKQIRNLLRDGVLPPPIRRSGRRPLYDYWACHHAYIDYIDGMGRQSNIAKKQEENLEKKNRKLDLEHKLAVGELVKADEVEFALKDLFTGIKTQLRSIPTKSAQELAHLKAHPGKNLAVQIQEVLQKEIDETLTELSKWKLPK
jgi:phage terminase Nu1 subunit (DNA packaging protein)